MARWPSLVALSIVPLVLAVAVLGAARPVEAAVGLVKGWNNIAYMGAAGPPAEALAALDGQYSVVYRWDASAKEYQVYAPGSPGFANSLSQLNPGDAIWLNLTAGSAELSMTGGGHVSIAASTFLPASDLAIYEKSFNELYPVGTDEDSQRYYANVTLPDGATVTSMTVAFAASGGGVVDVRLDYTPLGNGNDGGQVFKLVEVESSAGSSPQTAQAFAHTVDNSANVYFLIVDLTGGPNTKLYGVSIAYTGG